MTRPESASAVGGIVLAGGGSRRLGHDKASLDWHGTKLVERVARLLARGIGGGPIVVVGPHGEPDRFDLPKVNFESACDPVPDAGPLVGLLEGLHALEGRVESAVVAACDLPLLHPVTVRTLAQRLASGDFDVAAPTDANELLLPLPGAWRVSAAAQITAVIEDGGRSLRMAASRMKVLTLPLPSLAADQHVAQSDPQLRSLIDVDSATDLEELLSAPPRVRLARDGRILTPNAWTLGELAATSGGDPEGPCVVNGLPIEFDPRFPLAERDAVAMPPAVDL